MNKLFSKLKASGLDEPPPREDALDEYKDQLEARWQEFVHRARIHEMLKCLQSEHRRLQVLRDNIDFEELIPDDKHSPGSFEFLDKDEEMEDDTRRSEPHSLSATGSEIKRSMAGERKTALAIEIFKNKNLISDAEFEEILQLCDDKIEQQALRDAFEEKKNRDKYLHNATEQRQMLYDFINSQFIVKFMLITIIVSICGIFLLTFESFATRFAFPLNVLDSCIIGIFVVEATFKIVIYKLDYFKQIWNLLDMLIIVVHLLEVIVELITKTLALSAEISTHGVFRFLKSLRALRLLRIIKFLPNLQVVLLTVFQSMLSMGSIAVLMVLFIFVFAVMGRGLFYENSPVHFGSLTLAFITLFQLLTLDDWFDLLEAVKISPDNPQIESNLQYWIMFAYLFCYIVIEYFVFLNLFVAVLVDNFQLTLADAEIRRKKEEMLFLADQQKFDDMEKTDNIEDVDDELKPPSNAMNPDTLELNTEEYFPKVTKGSKEAQLCTEIFKDLNSLDFERFLWKRRSTIFNIVVDQALAAQQNTWNVLDADSDGSKDAKTLLEDAAKEQKLEEEETKAAKKK